MTTTHRTTGKSPARRKTSRLSTGFDMLTLDPSPHLRATRQELSQREPMAEAWRVIAKAMVTAMKSISRDLGTSR